MAILQVENLSVCFRTRHGTVRAVDDVSFRLNKGEVLGLVGESGCGKSVTCCSLLGLIPVPPGQISSGRAIFHGVDLLNCSMPELRDVRGRRISMIFQDPMTSLNPYLRISTQLIEPLLVHDRISRKQAMERAVQALREVGIQDAAERITDYPHEFSGGMRQRVMVAMALITEPEILIADEPTTALDVTVQAQILELIRSQQDRTGMSVIFVTHDLGVVAGFCDRVNVMYAGRLVESAGVREIFYSPRHPYTAALRRAVPRIRGDRADSLFVVPGRPPDLSRQIAGCPFMPRCDYAAEACREGARLAGITADHFSACVRIQKGQLRI